MGGLERAAAPSEQESAALFRLFETGRFAAAAALAQQWTQRYPLLSLSWNALGGALWQLGRRSDAVAPMQRAVDLAPFDTAALSNLGLALQSQGRSAEAEIHYRRLASLRPQDAEAHNGLGACMLQLRRPQEARASFETALRLLPDYAEAHNNLGVALQEDKRYDDAKACFLRALALRPDYPEAHCNLGAVLRELGRADEAQESCRLALALHPGYAKALNNLGVALQDEGRAEEAVACYRQALDLRPDYAEACNNLGAVLHDLGRDEEAEASFREALRIDPHYAKAQLSLGAAYQDQARLEEAASCYRAALAILPDYAEAHSNLGTALQDMGRLDAAQACFRRALQCRPDYADAFSNLLFSLNYAERGVDANLDEARRYGALVVAKAKAKHRAWTCDLHPTRLRVGIVSGDLRQHPVGNFLEGVLRHLGTARMDLIAYPTSGKTDELTGRIRSCFEAWHPLVGKSDEAAARIIHADGVHVLLDLSGHTAHNRLPVFAWKPAPAQASWLGYLASTGLDDMDFVIGDAHVIPPEDEAHFTERVWRLPQTYICFTPPSQVFEVAELPALRKGHVTFGSFNNLTKMNDAVVALWSRVMIAVPGSRLHLKSNQLAESSVRQAVARRFAAHGIGVDRLILQAAVPRDQYLQPYGEVDIGLDPFPYPGITTTVESLWMGVPVLTLAGSRFLGRQGAGLMRNAGLADWIAADADDYVARAVARAGNFQALADLRRRLRSMVEQSPIFDGRRFAQAFEAALFGIWEERQAVLGILPDQKA